MPKDLLKDLVLSMVDLVDCKASDSHSTKVSASHATKLCFPGRSGQPCSCSAFLVCESVHYRDTRLEA